MCTATEKLFKGLKAKMTHKGCMINISMDDPDHRRIQSLAEEAVREDAFNGVTFGTFAIVINPHILEEKIGGLS